MKGSEALLLEIATRISDGEAVDWDAANQGLTTEDDRQALSHLRLLETMTQVHRTGGDTLATVTGTEGETLPATGQLQEGDRWGRLRIRKLLGTGGFGEVYLAHDEDLQRDVALKLHHRVPQAAGDVDAYREAVLSEGRMMARVRHDNVVLVHGAESHDGRVGLWMEHVAGRTLSDVLRDQGSLGAREAAGIGQDLCRALAAVHAAGLIHRDVKANNVIREDGGRTVLMDFGAGVDVQQMAEGGPARLSGTPMYLAPEVLAGTAPTAGSDLYALGVLLYHLVSRRYPVEAASVPDLVRAHDTGSRRLLRDVRPDLPADFVAVVERALSPDPARRFQTAGEMERALAQVFASDEDTPKTPARTGEPTRHWGFFAILVGLGSVVAVVALVLALRGPTERTAKSPPVADTYSVHASILRVEDGGRRIALESGSTVQVDDKIVLEVRASRDLYVYAFNEDDTGAVWALFPLEGLPLTNPLPAGETHRLPGVTAEGELSWEISTDGRRERFVVMTSPDRLVEFERELGRASQPQSGSIGLPLGADAQRLLRGTGSFDVLRGVGRITPVAPGSPQPRLFDLARILASQEEQVSGVWLRRVELIHAPQPDEPSSDPAKDR